MQGQHWQISLQPCWCINTVISDAAGMREPLSEAESFWYQHGKWFSADHYTHWPVISSTTCEAGSELSAWFIIYFSLAPGCASQAAWSRAEELVWFSSACGESSARSRHCQGLHSCWSTPLLALQCKRSGMSQDAPLARVDGLPSVFLCQGFYWSPVFWREDWLWWSCSSIASCIWASLARIKPFPASCR